MKHLVLVETVPFITEFIFSLLKVSNPKSFSFCSSRTDQLPIYFFLFISPLNSKVQHLTSFSLVVLKIKSCIYV